MQFYAYVSLLYLFSSEGHAEHGSLPDAAADAVVQDTNNGWSVEPRASIDNSTLALDYSSMVIAANISSTLVSIPSGHTSLLSAIATATANTQTLPGATTTQFLAKRFHNSTSILNSSTARSSSDLAVSAGTSLSLAASQNSTRNHTSERLHQTSLKKHTSTHKQISHATTTKQTKVTSSASATRLSSSDNQRSQNIRSTSIKATATDLWTTTRDGVPIMGHGPKPSIRPQPQLAVYTSNTTFAATFYSDDQFRDKLYQNLYTGCNQYGGQCQGEEATFTLNGGFMVVKKLPLLGTMEFTLGPFQYEDHAWKTYLVSSLTTALVTGAESGGCYDQNFQFRPSDLGFDGCGDLKGPGVNLKGGLKERHTKNELLERDHPPPDSVIPPCTGTMHVCNIPEVARKFCYSFSDICIS